LLEPGLKAVIDALQGVGPGTGTVADGIAAVEICSALINPTTTDRVLTAAPAENPGAGR